MNMQSKPAEYVVANSEIVSEEFDGEFVVLDIGCGKYYSMDRAASAVWRAIVAGVSVSALADAVKGAPNVSAQSIYEFAETLVDYGCLARSDAPASATIDLETLDVLMTSSSPPTVEAFDDLAELIMSDPIHDVEETAGWPVRKPVAAE